MGSEGGSWNYANEAQWPSFYSSCNSQTQSPIDVLRNITIYDKNLKNFVFNNYDKLLKYNISFTGTDLKFDLNSNQIVPFVTGSDLNSNFNFLNFHFHWGNSSLGF